VSEKSEMLRHFLASTAYHATKALRDAPDHYPELDIGKGVRTPGMILHHIAWVLSYAHSFYEHYETTRFEQKPWRDEVKHFYETLSKLDKSLREKSPREVSEEQLGQLLMLRRLADAPVPSENFIYADIRKGVVGPNQPEPVMPDE